MAIKHRKLFPSSAGNDTAACPYICDQTCPYGCDSYPDSYYMPPPPLPPPPPPPPRALATNQSQHVSPYVIMLVTIFSSLFLLVSYYVIIVKYCSNWNIFRPRRSQSGGRDDEFLDENRGPGIDHPIWYITTMGLQPSVINSITIFRYKKGESLTEGTTCSVCLSEFQDDETLRLLPKCNHAFHIPCIDTWLRSHTNCPLCRAGIVSNTANFPPSDNQNSNTMNPNQGNQIESEENDERSDNNYVRDGEICEFREVGTEDETEISQVHDEIKDTENSKTSVNCIGNASFYVVDDSVDHGMVMDEEIRPVRRSVSMDMLRAERTGLAVNSSHMTESEGSSVDSKTDKQSYDVDNPSDENSGIIRMMRSFSYGGRSFLFRHHRSPNSILPV